MNDRSETPYSFFSGGSLRLRVYCKASGVHLDEQEPNSCIGMS